MLLISAIVFLGIFLHGLLSEIGRQTANVTLDGLLILRMNFAIIYGLCPLTIFVFEDLYGENVDVFDLFASQDVILTIAVAALFSYTTSLISYRLARNSARLERLKPPIPFEIRSQDLFLLYIFLMLVSAISLVIYVNQYGGYARTVELAGIIRQNLQDDVLVTEGSLIFFQNFTVTSFAATAVAVALFARTGRMLHFAMVIAGIVLSAAVASILASRGYIVIFVLIMLVAWLSVKFPRGKKLAPVVFLLLAVLIFVTDYFLSVGKLISISLYRDEVTVGDVLRDHEYVPLASIVGYYDEYIASLIAVLSYGHLEFTYFYDSIAAPLYLIPGRLFGIEKPETIITFNTYLVTGIWIPSTPPGLIGYGYYSLGFIGIAISSVVYAAVLGKLDQLRYKLSLDDSNFAVIYPPLLMYWGIYFFQGDPRNLTISLVPTALSIVALWALPFFRIRPRTKLNARPFVRS